MRNSTRQTREGLTDRAMVELTDYQFTLCNLFSNESAKSQQRIEFGQSTTKEREIHKIACDNLIGKMAEVAIAQMLREKFGLHIPVNYEVYPRGEYDDDDLVINGWTVDVKATKNGRFMLVEKHKVDFRIKEGALPDAFMMGLVPCDKEEKPIGCVELIGGISSSKLLSSKKVLQLKKGECIPGTSSRLKADNYAVAFKDLTDIETMVRYFLKNRKTERKNESTASD